MKRWMVLFLALGIAAPACVTKEKSDDKKSSSDDEEDEDDDKASKKSKKSKDKDDDEKKTDKKSRDDEKDTRAEIDAQKLLEEDTGEGSAVLDIRLPDDAKKDAPSLGGGTLASPSAANVTWLPAGPLAVPNPGWKRSDKKGDKGAATILTSPDETAAVVFTTFTSLEDGRAKVDTAVKGFDLRNQKWKKPKQVNIGPDKVPAFVGAGDGVHSGGTPLKLFFAMIKTGGPQNLLAIGISDNKASEATSKAAFNIVASIKRNK